MAHFKKKALVRLLAASTVASISAFSYAEKMEEIVVTAQKREEKLQDVPLTISAFSAETLQNANIDGTRGLTQVTPGLNFAMQGAYAQPTIRGVGTQGTSAGDESNVAMYVDGVYMPSQIANTFELKGIQRVEVLKGPQGTLFGRNATGGLINVITKDPQQETSGEASFSFGRFNEKKASVYATTGLTDTIAVDISALTMKDDGYVKDIRNGNNLAKKDSQAVRSKLLFQPSDSTKIVASVDYSERNDISTFSSAPLKGNNSTGFSTKPFDAALNVEPIQDTRNFGGYLRGDFDFTGVALSSITGYRKVHARNVADADASPTALFAFDYGQDSESMSQEFNLTSVGESSLHWITGVFVYRENAGLNPFFGLKNSVQTDAEALFGEVTYDFTDRLSAIVGARYSHEKKAFKFGPAGVTLFEDEKTWSDITPRASLRYRITDNTNAYATYSEGFKSGVYNSTAGTQVPADPETIKAYEVGIKTSELPDLNLNAALFYYDYADIQVQAFTAGGGNSVITLQNAANATVKGADLDATYFINDALNLKLGLSYVDGTYDSFPGAQVFRPVPSGLGNGAARNEDASGNDMIRSPKWTANLGFDFRTPLAAGELSVTGNYYYNNGFYWDIGNRVKQDAYGLLNSTVAWSPTDGKYRLSLWGKNLTDETYETYVATNAFGDSVNYGQPLSYGVAVDFRF